MSILPKPTKKLWSGKPVYISDTWVSNGHFFVRRSLVSFDFSSSEAIEKLNKGWTTSLKDEAFESAVEGWSKWSPIRESNFLHWRLDGDMLRIFTNSGGPPIALLDEKYVAWLRNLTGDWRCRESNGKKPSKGLCVLASDRVIAGCMPFEVDEYGFDQQLLEPIDPGTF